MDNVDVKKVGSHVTLILLTVIFVTAGIGAGVLYLIKSPVRRHRVLGLFRGNRASVSYSRVDENVDTTLLDVRRTTLNESDDDMLI
uniref:CSON003666 protein n=1 Tax=Culicoides sonorensis TaxID=179676 RepID=A0A336LIV3_CULSO